MNVASRQCAQIGFVTVAVLVTALSNNVPFIDKHAKMMMTKTHGARVGVGGGRVRKGRGKTNTENGGDGAWRLVLLLSGELSG